MSLEELNAKILVIDDDNGPRQSIRFLMKAWEVDLAEDGPVGLEKVRATRYDAVILDLRMPKMGGVEVLRFIREIDPDVAVVMWTAFADLDSAAESLRLGADDYQCKPFNAQSMRQALSAAVARCRERRRQRILLSDARHEEDRLMQELLQKGQDHDIMRAAAVGVCHDVNNQLQTAAGIVEIASIAEMDFDTSQQLLLAHSSLRRCTEIVSELIKAPNAPRKEEQKTTDLNRVVQDVLDSMALGKIEVRLDIPPIHVAGEYLKVHRALFNIVHNAAEALGARTGRLSFIAKPSGAMVDLWVRDTAGGVAEPERAFELNYTSGKLRGHGLGLHIARTLIRDCGGDIRLRNFPGDGAAFILSLRRVNESVPTQQDSRYSLGLGTNQRPAWPRQSGTQR
ncbi:MAG: signal transduction histidine kinase [Rhodothermales bacterium]|jgi:signal transduction histidine kinase